MLMHHSGGLHIIRNGLRICPALRQQNFHKCFVHALEYFGGVLKVVLTKRIMAVIVGAKDERTLK